MCKSSTLLDLLEFVLEPLNLMSWVASVVEQPPVKIVASFHVEGNNSSFLVELEWFGVIAILAE